MTNTIFVSGKNWKLSLAELAAYNKTKKIDFHIEFFSREFFTLESNQPIEGAIIDHLGGTIKIGQAKIQLPTQQVREAFLEKNKQAMSGLKQALAQSSIIANMAKADGKILFGVSVYCAEKSLRPFAGVMQRSLGSAVKDELVAYGKKSKFMGTAKDRGVAQLSHVEVLKKNLVANEAELLLCIGREKTWIAVTVGVHNPFEFQKRDIYKPNQRKIFAMPPRLARIMANLSACTSQKTLLDPFCGVGTILQEALLEGPTVVGMDVNSWCVKAATEILEWLAREYSIEDSDFRVVHGDVSKLVQKIGQATIDCIATEPDLGPALKQIPTDPYAQKIIHKLEPLFYSFIQEAFMVLKLEGRLVLVTPYIITRSKHAITMPIGEKLEKLGYKRVELFTEDMFLRNATPEKDELMKMNSLVEIDERHKISREIHVYEKF
jgi:tRNA G10  N-methylase Trm11